MKYLSRRSVGSARETRLIRKGDIGQLGKDIDSFHLRGEDGQRTAGSFIMAPAVGITKIGNAIVGEFSDQKSEPLREGALAYTTRDIRSGVRNTLGALGALVTLHPFKALGRGAKAVFDGVDVVFVDPWLDFGSLVFKHTEAKTTPGILGLQNRSQMKAVLDEKPAYRTAA